MSRWHAAAPSSPLFGTVVCSTQHNIPVTYKLRQVWLVWCVLLMFSRQHRLNFFHTSKANWATVNGGSPLCACLRMCVMLKWCQVEKTGDFLHLCQFQTYGERKEDRARMKKRESERGEATWSEFPIGFVSYQITLEK